MVSERRLHALLSILGVGFVLALVGWLRELSRSGYAAPRARGHLNGRARVTDLSDNSAAERALVDTNHRVSDLVAANRLTMALQPVVDLSTGRVAGVEALARFPDGRGPEDWFRDARTTGHAVELDRLAFTSALRLLPELPEGCYLAINASPELLADGSLLRCLAHADESLPSLVVEITEHDRISSYQQLHAALTQLRERGVRLAIDDVGAGYASFSHVLQLCPDIIKIDRFLVTGLGSDLARHSLVTALVLLALDLNVSVTAEGVEHPQELETLASLGVDCAQGYLFGRASTATARWQHWFTRNWLYPPVDDSVSEHDATTSMSA